MTNAFSPGYVSQLAPLKKTPPAKKPANAFDGDDARARMACVKAHKLRIGLNRKPGPMRGAVCP